VIELVDVSCQLLDHRDQLPTDQMCGSQSMILLRRSIRKCSPFGLVDDLELSVESLEIFPDGTIDAEVHAVETHGGDELEIFSEIRRWSLSWVRKRNRSLL